MTTFVFICLAIIEIFFQSSIINKQRQKRKWLTNRILLSVTALIIFFSLYLFFLKVKWRYTLYIIFVILRLIISVILYLIKRRKIDGKRLKPSIFLSIVVSLLFTALTLLPAWIFTDYNGLTPTGEYDVIEIDAILVDESRKDSFESDGSYCEIPAHFFYPDNYDQKYPLVIFSHGAFGYYKSNYSTCSELASHGYVVVSLDYPHHSFFTKNTDGKTIIVDMKFINNVMKVTNGELPEKEIFELSKEWLKLRIDDGNFAIDSIKTAVKNKKLNDSWHIDNESDIIDILKIIDIEKIGVFGHSLGGAESVQLGRERNDIDAVIDIDGTMFGEELSYENDEYQFIKKPYPLPVLELCNAKTHYELEELEEDSDFKYANTIMMENALDGRSIWFENTEHMNFTDLPLFSPLLAKKLGTGTIDPEECIKNVNKIVVEFFDYYLKKSGKLELEKKY